MASSSPEVSPIIFLTLCGGVSTNRRYDCKEGMEVSYEATEHRLAVGPAGHVRVG
ncbi:hypothetical protein COCNU_14G010670 [Cocos nucifera]|uniref:Uncharacterized protein n=1 Tax=Cocos nucifera TaxID=13894 RepID=A0A8K0IXC3_COCNU|nr:hypothetical protein COCNU_14G010670 [Cocos nucifera]